MTVISTKILNLYCVICSSRTSPLNAYFTLDIAILLYFKQKNFSGGWIKFLTKIIVGHLPDFAYFFTKVKIHRFSTDCNFKDKKGLLLTKALEIWKFCTRLSGLRWFRPLRRQPILQYIHRNTAAPNSA